MTDELKAQNLYNGTAAITGDLVALRVLTSLMSAQKSTLLAIAQLANQDGPKALEEAGKAAKFIDAGVDHLTKELSRLEGLIDAAK